MKNAGGRTGTGNPGTTGAGRGAGGEKGDRAAARHAGTHRRRGIRLHSEDPTSVPTVPALGVDMVELASRRGAEGDDDWDDTSEEPVLVVNGTGADAAFEDRPDLCAPAGGLPAGSGDVASGRRAVAARPGASAGYTLAVLVGALGLMAGGAALWLTTSAQAEVEQIRASLALPDGPAGTPSENEVEAARLAALRGAVERLQERIAALEAVMDHAPGTAGPAVVPRQAPTGRQDDAPAFDGMWLWASPGSVGLTAVAPAAELAAAWSEVRWPEVSVRPCVLARDGGCGDGGKVGR